MIKAVSTLEKGVYAVLMGLLMIVLFGSLLDLIWLLYEALWITTPALIETRELIAVFGAFLLVLIGVELLDTIKAYFHENAIHVEIVVLLAIIAVSRKVILLDPTGANGIEFGIELMGTGVIVVSLAAAYYLLKKTGITVGPGESGKSGE